MPIVTRVCPTDKIEINGARVTVERKTRMIFKNEVHIRIERESGEVFERKPRGKE